MWGNFAASLLPMSEAARPGCDQVVFLDAGERRYVEELGDMNIFFVHSDGRVVTPASESIFEGVVKDSLRAVAADLGHDVVERPFTIEEWKEGVASRLISEVFACGTAAVIAPIGERLAEGEQWYFWLVCPSSRTGTEGGRYWKVITQEGFGSAK